MKNIYVPHHRYERILDGEKELLKLHYEGIAKRDFHSYRVSFTEISEQSWTEVLRDIENRSEIPFVVERQNGVRVSFVKAGAYYWSNQRKMLFLRAGMESLYRLIRRVAGCSPSYERTVIYDLTFVCYKLQRFMDGDRELLKFSPVENDEKWYIYSINPIAMSVSEFADVLFERIPVSPSMYFECSDGQKVPLEQMFFGHLDVAARKIHVR